MQKIVVELQGGLGNQLFQFANAFRIKKMFELPHNIVFYTSLLIKQSKNPRFTSRDFSLHELDLKNRTSVFDNFLIKLNESNELQIFLKFIAKSHFSQYPFKVSEETFELSKFDLANRKLIFLSGFWQDYLYYLECRTEISILVENSLKRNLSPLFKKLYSEISDTRSLVIHFRRGDYMSNSKARNFHGVLGDNYFEEAYRLDTMGDQSKKVFIFTEDRGEIGTSFDFIPYRNTRIIDNSFNLTSWEILLLMRASTSLIMSNSSLSWWSAFSNLTPVRQNVYGPSRWFLQEDKRLMLPEWTTLDPNFI